MYFFFSDGEKGSPRSYRRHSKDEDHYPKSSKLLLIYLK
jgi:hypothetical protein